MTKQIFFHRNQFVSETWVATLENKIEFDKDSRISKSIQNGFEALFHFCPNIFILRMSSNVFFVFVVSALINAVGCYLTFRCSAFRSLFLSFFLSRTQNTVCADIKATSFCIYFYVVLHFEYTIKWPEQMNCQQYRKVIGSM